MKIYILFTSVMLSVSALTVGICRAQGVPQLDPATAGTLYYVAFPDTTTNTYDTRFLHQKFNDTIQVLLYSAVNTIVTITPLPTGTAQTYNLQAGVFRAVDINGPDGFPNSVVTQSGQTANNTFRIASADPVIVYCYILTGFGCEAWTAIPVPDWGLEYFASALPGELGADLSPGGESNFIRINKAFPSELLIVAAYDNTTVTIQPNGTLQNYPLTTVTLNAGQAYQVQCTVDTLLAHFGNPEYQSDQGGTRIIADRPVGVITGNTRAQIIQELPGLGLNSFKNMMIEWLTPIEQHGTNFVYMPTWDARRLLGTPNEVLNGKRLKEVVRVFASGDTPDTVGILKGNNNVPVYSAIAFRPSVGNGGYSYTDTVTAPVARAYHTKYPAQACMFSPGVTKNKGSIGGGSFIGASYDAWGGYQVMLVPREQWGTFAPYYAPANPDSMEHFINVVTDTASKNRIYTETGSLFVFNQGVIPGTDLIWGTMTVAPGVTHYLEGRSGARFYGFCYGIRRGYELFRPGKAGRDPGAGTQAVHPAEYEENLGLGYGYPLALRHTLLNKPDCDTLIINTTRTCTCVTYTIRSAAGSVVGLRSLRVDSALNTRMTQVNPGGQTGDTLAVVSMCPVQEWKNATATLVITDRRGCITRLPYSYTVQELSYGATPMVLVLRAGQTKDTVLIVSNPASTGVRIDSVWMASGAAFSVTGGTTLPATLASGGAMTVALRYKPKQSTVYRDTVWFQMDCNRYPVPLFGQTQGPCIALNDLDFGPVRPNEPKTMAYQICNKDTAGILTFVPPYIGLPVPFSIGRVTLDVLMRAALSPGECITINISLSADPADTGQVNKTLRFYTNASCGIDSAAIKARISTAGVHDAATQSQALSLHPNPAGNYTVVRFSTRSVTACTVRLYDLTGRTLRVISEGPTGRAGERQVTVPTDDLPAGAYHLRLTDNRGNIQGTAILQITR